LDEPGIAGVQRRLEVEQRIPFGDDNGKDRQRQGQLQWQQQIPFGDDNQKEQATATASNGRAGVRRWALVVFALGIG
jgi:hypothetical protein